MKLTNTHLLNEFFKLENRYRYNQHEKLFVTKKIIQSSVQIMFNSVDKCDDDFIDNESLNEELDNILGMLSKRNVLLIFPNNENLVYEYSFNGLYLSIVVHVWVKNKIVKSETIFFKKGILENNNFGFSGTKINGTEYDKMFMLSEIREVTDDYETLEDYFFFNSIYLLKVMLFIELSKDKVSYKTILPKSKTGHILKGDLFKNETTLSITQVDSLWNVESISLGEFKVRGHFRLQRCGTGFREVKLIYINEFKKTQYIRRRTRDLTFTDSE